MNPQRPTEAMPPVFDPEAAYDSGLARARRVRAYIRGAESLLESLRADVSDWYVADWTNPTEPATEKLDAFAKRIAREGMQASRLLKKAVREARK